MEFLVRTAEKKIDGDKKQYADTKTIGIP